jgi:hypothetical protein
MMDRRRSRIVYLLALVLLLSAGAAAQRVSATDEANRMVRVFADWGEIRLMKEVVFERHRMGHRKVEGGRRGGRNPGVRSGASRH